MPAVAEETWPRCWGGGVLPEQGPFPGSGAAGGRCGFRLRHADESPTMSALVSASTRGLCPQWPLRNRGQVSQAGPWSGRRDTDRVPARGRRPGMTTARPQDQAGGWGRAGSPPHAACGGVRIWGARTPPSVEEGRDKEKTSTPPRAALRGDGNQRTADWGPVGPPAAAVAQGEGALQMPHSKLTEPLRPAPRVRGAEG